MVGPFGHSPMTTKSASILAGMKAAIAAKKAARRHHKPLAREHIIFIARCISDLEDDDERAAATRDFAAVHRMTAGRFDAGHVQFGRITFIGPAAPRRRKNPNTSSTLTGCGGPARRDAGDGTAGQALSRTVPSLRPRRRVLLQQPAGGCKRGHHMGSSRQAFRSPLSPP